MISSSMLQIIMILILLVLLIISLTNLRNFRKLGKYPAPDHYPFVSILVPARNEEGKISSCIHSLLSQNYTDFEIIVLLDHSTDRTENILQKIALKNKKVKMTYSIELYYNHLMDRIPGKPIYRFNGQIPYPELWDIREKDRIEIPKELKDDAVFDSGGLYFWVFSNAIIFKTI